MFSSLLKEVTGILDKRFFLNVFLPCLMFWGFLIAAWFAGRGELSIAARNWSEQEMATQLVRAVAFLGWVILFASVMESNSTAILRFYEGYWSFPLGGFLQARGRQLHEQKLTSLSERLKKDTNDASAYDEIYLTYPLPEQEAELMPTRLGNILKNAELYPRDRYGLDAVLFWPRLYSVFPPDFAKTISELRGGLDTMLLVTTLAIAFALLSGGYLLIVRASWWLFLLCFGGGVIAAFTAYRGAMGSVLPYAEQIKAAFDLYRNDLLLKMRLPLPVTLKEENQCWLELGRLVYSIAPANPDAWRYTTVPVAPKEKPPPQ
jgi:hypothetical protein